MDERIRESISALMDDEVNELELQRLLTHIEREELNDKWKSYHKIRGAMSPESSQPSSQSLLEIDISQSVSEWIDTYEGEEAEASNVQSPVSSNERNGKFGGFIGVAASMLFAIAFVFQNSDSSISQLDIQIAETTTQAPAVQVASHREPKIIDQINEDHARRLNQYLLRHAEHSMHGSRQGAMPFVRVASVNSVGI